MNLSDKELRKLLKEAWDKGRRSVRYAMTADSIRGSRHRDVTKIIKKAKEKEASDG